MELLSLSVSSGKIREAGGRICRSLIAELEIAGGPATNDYRALQ